ncbi:MAG TPA: efflux transporter outer membrane subunit [Nitrospiria bacterium]|nr:efflux transporter outer membrane subunit [Nitrospiria bacterium]
MGVDPAGMNGLLRWAARGCCAAALLAMSGCAVGPDFVRPKPPPVGAYDRGPAPNTTIPADGQAQHFLREAAFPSDWWRLFNSAALDTVIEQAIADNLSLRASQASLRRSQESLRAGYGVFFPQLDAGFDATRQKFSPARFGSSTPSSIFSLYTLSATVNYPLDLFGGERRALEGLSAQVDAQRDAVLASYLALTSNIVNTVIARAAYGAEIKALEEVIGLEKNQVRISQAQAQAGLIPYVNVLSLQSQVAATEATLPPLRQKLSQSDHLLSTLAGRAPAEWAPPDVDLADLTLPGDLPVSLPSELVRRRPDILAAEAQLHEASASIGVATAALFPSVTLNGTYGQNNAPISDLLKKTGNFWSLGADLSTPLFHGGTLWFQRKAAIEGYRQSQNDYRQTVLDALAQVADALRALEHDAESLQAQLQALNASQRALQLVQANFKAGVAGYVQVLIANDQYARAKIGYLESRAQRFQDTVALFVALGGGWWNAPAIADNSH